MSSVICSPSSLTRPWINFEAGCGWIQGIEMIPVCHSGQRKDQLPFPFSELQALQLEDEAFGELLLQALVKCFKFNRVPRVREGILRRKIERAKNRLFVPDASPQIIHSPSERTQLINSDLQTLLRSDNLHKETVWTSAFLSSFAIGPDDPYSSEEHDYLQLLLREKELLLTLARKGCKIKCIISPANRNYVRHSGIDYAIKRTQRLLDFLKSEDRALTYIDWAISELGTKNDTVAGLLSHGEPLRA